MSNLNADDAKKMANGLWMVLRHSGRADRGWSCRGAFNENGRKGAGQMLAEAKFKKLKADMRQGGLAVLTPLGVIFSYYEAPRIRSRW